MRPLHFRWKYIALPLGILGLSAAMAAFFYPRLPAALAYHFAAGAPDRWMDRASFLAWMLVPQFLLAGLAGGVIRGMLALARRAQPEKTPEGILLVMGNMIALPQAILSFAMLNVFSYNAYGAQIMPLWLFALIVMALGGGALGVFFILAMRQTLLRK